MSKLVHPPLHQRGDEYEWCLSKRGSKERLAYTVCS